MTHYNVTVGTEKFLLDEKEMQTLKSLIGRKEKGLFDCSSGSFLIEAVRSIKSMITVSYDTEKHEYPELSEEKRQTNLRRIRWFKAYFFNKAEAINSIPNNERAGFEAWVAHLNSPAQVERRAKKQQFKGEFFDVYFATHEEEEASYQAWLKATSLEADPREYNRDNMTPTALGTRELTDAQAVFDV